MKQTRYHLKPCVCVPYVNSSVCRAGEHVFWVWREATVDWEALVVEVSSERLEGVAGESVNQSH